jgi:polyisoprenoid-binding protein YceI
MRKFLVIITVLTFSLVGFKNHGGGIYKSNTGNITFFSNTSLEDIEAENHKVKTAFDSKSGKIQFSVLVKDFRFEKALMQEHFNENYLESDKFPKSTFSGTIEQIEKINFEKDGVYTSTVSGNLKIKDITKKVSTVGTFTVEGGKVHAKASFYANPEDYNIKIPKVVTDKISRNIKVSIDVAYVHAH